MKWERAYSASIVAAAGGVVAARVLGVSYRSLAPGLVAVAAYAVAANLLRARWRSRPVQWFDLSPACVAVCGILLFFTAPQRAGEAAGAAWLVLLLAFAVLGRGRDRPLGPTASDDA